MRYLDTSFVVPLIVPEASSAALSIFMTSIAGEHLMTSRWTEVEFCSTLGRDVRHRVLDPTEALAAEEKFGQLTKSLHVVLPDADDFSFAAKLLRHYDSGLRGPDALHLAIASNRKVEEVLSLDKTMIRAGNMLGIRVSPGVLLPGYD